MRDKERQREGEQHVGIISDSVWGLARNAEVWHTTMWSRSGLVSLLSPPLPPLCSAGNTAATIPYKFTPDTSLTCLWFPLSHTVCTHAHAHASPCSHTEAFGERCSWSTGQFRLDFPPWMLQQNKSNVFFWLAGDHERCILSRWSDCTVQLCWDSHLHADSPTGLSV